MSVKNNLYAWQYFNRQKFVNWRHRRKNHDAAAILNGEPKKVLFVVAGLLGDAVMSTPAIIAARELWQNAHFTVLGQKHNLDLLGACPHVNEFYETPVIPFSLRKRPQEKKLKQWLASENFDVAIVLSGGQFGAVLAEAKIPIRVAGRNHQTRLPNCFTHLYDDETPRLWGPSEQLNAIRALGYDGANILPELWTENKARQTAREKLRALGLSENSGYAVIHPFGSTHRQWWRLDEIAGLAANLKTEYDLQTVLIGGKETVASVAPETAAAVVNTTGQLSLPELLAVVEAAEIVVTTDSGPFHIAGALGKNIVGLFRARRPEHAHNYPNAAVAFGEFESCKHNCRWDFCQSDPCEQMQRISLEEVLRAVKSLPINIISPEKIKL